MPVDKFGRGDYGETNIIQHTFTSSREHADDIYLRRDGGNVATGSISMAGNTLNDVGNPTADYDVATKSYCDNRARKIFNGYIPAMTSFAGRMNQKMGFKATASSIRNNNHIADNPFNGFYSEGHGSGGEWLTLNQTRDFWIQIEVPDLVRIWRVDLRGRDCGSNKIYHWKLEGSTDGENYTALLTLPNPTYLDNTVKKFLVDIDNSYNYYRLYCFRGEPFTPGLSYMQLYIYSE